MGPAELVREVVEPLLAPAGLELVDVEVQPGVLRLSLDRPGGIDLEAISRISPAITAALDETDPIPERHQLEISSPGLERPLRTPEHFARFVGSKVSVRTLPGTEGERRVTGLLTSADDTAIEVVPEGAGTSGGAKANGAATADGATGATPGGAATIRIPYQSIERARTVFEWGPSPKPGKSKKR